MKYVTQILPEGQKDIIREGLELLEVVLNEVSDKSYHKLFDILTLKRLLNGTEVAVNVPFEVYENFTALNGVDFPEYVEGEVIYISLHLCTQDGERRYIHKSARCLPKGTDIDEWAEEYCSSFWGGNAVEPDEDGKYDFGDVISWVESVKEITVEEYTVLNKFLP